MTWRPWQAQPSDVAGTGTAQSALQPLTTATASIVAAYAFNEPAAACNTDRSGNGNDFVTSNLASELANVPDIIPGKAAVLAGGAGLYDTSPASCTQVSQAWNLYAALTIVMRVWMCAPVGVPKFRNFVVANANNTTLGSVAFQLACDSSNQLTYYAERLKVAQLLTAPSLVVTPNQWLGLSLRRYVSGEVRLGIASGQGGRTKTYVDSSGLLLPQSADTTGMFTQWGNAYFSPAQPAGAAWADACVWSTALTDAQVEEQLRVAMAGVP